MIRDARDIDGSGSQSRLGVCIEQCPLERLECGSSRLVQRRKPDADSLVEHDIPALAAEGRRTKSSHMIDDILARDRLGAGRLDGRALRTRLVPRVIVYDDFELLSLPHAHVNRDRDLHPRLGALLRIGGKFGRAHAKHAVANGYRLTHTQVLRLALEGIGRLDRVGDASLRGPELEQVAHRDIGVRGELHLAGGIPRNAPDGHAAIVGALVAHHVVSTFTGKVALRKPTVERLGKGILGIGICLIGSDILPRPVNGIAISRRNRRDVLGRLHASFDLERRDIGFDEPVNHLDAAQVTRAQQVLPFLRKLLAVFIDKFVGQTARLGAQTAIGATSADERGCKVHRERIPRGQHRA